MDSSGLTVPVSVLREAARRRVEATSLRAFASESGVSYTALRGFLSGSDPYSENLRRLTAWYLRSSAEVEGGLVKQALRILVAGLPEAKREEASRDLVATLERHYNQVGLASPEWFPQ